jgi:hypothetical protein
MSLEKHGRLIELLLQRTSRGQIDWKPAVQEEAFQVSFKDNSVRISKDEEQDERWYKLELINNQGSTVDVVTSFELDHEQQTNLHWHLKMRELHDLARRTAFGAEKVLNQILSELRDPLDDEIPF